MNWEKGKEKQNQIIGVQKEGEGRRPMQRSAAGTAVQHQQDHHPNAAANDKIEKIISNKKNL